MVRASAGRTGGRLLLAAGLLTVLNNVLPGADHLNVLLLNLLALLALALGGLCLVLPWERLPARSSLVVAGLAFLLLSTGTAFGGVSAYSYAIYYVVVFVWIGLAHPPHTSFWMAPFATVAYLLPFLVVRPAPTAAVSSVLVAIPVCVLVAEVLARAVARLLAAREHEVAVMNVLPDGVLVLDPAGRVRSCNAVATELLARSRDELVGAAPELTLGPPDKATPSVLGERRIETVVTHLGGTDERVVTIRDITRQSALDEAKDLFLATTSHELRTPLTAIKGFVHVLQRRWDALDDTRRREALATVAERTEALVSLTDHLLLGVRAGAARHSASNAPFALVVTLTQVVEAMSVATPGRELTLDVGVEPLLALGDPHAVRHVVTQLIENAVKFSPRGGAVHLTASRVGAVAVVEVADEGIGLPAGNLEQLFKPFFQVDASNTREYAGVGLGLYIVRELVEAQGGEVTARQRPGGGAVLGFTLPLSAPVPIARSSHEQTPGAPARRTPEPAVIDLVGVVHDASGNPEDSAREQHHTAHDGERH